MTIFFVDTLFANSHIHQQDFELLLPKVSQVLKEKQVESLPVFSPENFASIPQNRSQQQAVEIRKPRPSSSAPRILSVHAPAGVELYEATYSGIDVYELVINDVQVMRRRDGGWVNATHILKVAGVEKGRRTKVIDKEIKVSKFEKVQGGYGKYQGTWVPVSDARDVARFFNVLEICAPILDVPI